LKSSKQLAVARPVARIRRMKRQFAVVLLGFMYNNQHVNLIHVEPL
jgi:hypothetical protein